MMNYVLVGSNKIDEAKVFYDTLLPTIGMNKLFDNAQGGRIYGSPATAMFGVTPPWDEKPANFGNGSLFGFRLQSREQVADFHAKAIELGGTCEGPPGERAPGAYFAYFRDLDGNKLCGYVSG